MMQNETAGASLPATVPDYTLHAPPPPAARFDFGERRHSGHELPPENEPEKPLSCAYPIPMAAFPRIDCLPNTIAMTRIGELRPLGQLHNSFIIAAGTRWALDHRSARGA